MEDSVQGLIELNGDAGERKIWPHEESDNGHPNAKCTHWMDPGNGGSLIGQRELFSLKIARFAKVYRLAYPPRCVQSHRARKKNRTRQETEMEIEARFEIRILTSNKGRVSDVKFSACMAFYSRAITRRFLTSSAFESGR